MIGEGPYFDISYAVKQASGEWKIVEAGGHVPAGSPGMILAAGMCQWKIWILQKRKNHNKIDSNSFISFAKKRVTG